MRSATLKRAGRLLQSGSAAAALTAAASWLQAQPITTPEATNGRTFFVEPSLTVRETLTNNIGLTTTDRQSDLITEVVPEIRIRSNGGRVRGFFDYAPTGLLYARNSSSNTVLNALNAMVTAEAVPNWAFIDVNANISQQAISAFGRLSTDPALLNNNRTEVRTLTLSPYVTGKFTDLADYEARATQTYSRDTSSATSDYDSTEVKAQLTGPSSTRLLNWSADATGNAIQYQGGRRLEDDRVRAFLYVTPDPQLRLSLIGGREANNYFSLERQQATTSGLGADWRPSERTRVSLQQEKRFFGSSHSYIFEYRTPRTVWRYSDINDIETSFGGPSLSSVGTAYDLFFAQFASVQPDPALRSQLVDAFLQANGISPATPVFAGSRTSTVLQEHRQELSFAFQGIRDTVLFSATQTRSSRVDSVSRVLDDFLNGNLVEQRGFVAQWSHRLTPLSALNAVGLVNRTSGSQVAQSSILRSINLIWTGQLAPRIRASAGLRHSDFSSSSNPYKETAVTADVRLQF
jgi:uncharacterized protein (PEP-CTERM system associated)